MDSLDQTPVFRLADAYVDAAAALDPVWATEPGVTGYDDRLTDYSPDGIEARAALCRQTLVELAAAVHARIRSSSWRRRCWSSASTPSWRSSMPANRCADLNNIASPVQSIRDVFDLMAYDTVDDWELAGRRLAAVPEAVAGAVAAYEQGRGQGLTAARRQAMEAADQAAAWAGDGPDEPVLRRPGRPGRLRGGGHPGPAGRTGGRRPRPPPRPTPGWPTYLRGTYAPDATDIRCRGCHPIPDVGPGRSWARRSI